MLKGFRDFISRGNVIDLAVAVVVGAAFTAVVTKFSEAFIKPLIQLIGGGDELSGVWQVRDATFDWAAFVNAVIAFLITAAVVYFVFVLPMNKLAERRRRGATEEPVPVSDEIQLLTEIRDLLRAQQRGDLPGEPRRDA
ncbi:MAG: large conductance mechanosensitive channel protein MscL [Dactylosporangium sp.]|nr:large conductance mechanosensitive channel protein MscL [Dactylosporangium sp.]NNJ62133.1 large conductance mechanosensitive channel protein MscL [Dactylosporangium sp.]